MLISDLIGKRAYNISTAVDLGNITSSTYRDGCINYFLTDKGYAFRTKDIVANNTAITCSMHSVRSELQYKIFPHTGVAILTTDGKIIGTLSDIMLDREYKVTKLICDHKNTKQFHIKSYSDSAIVLEANNRKRDSSHSQNISIPTTVANYDFLIGRTLFKNILSANGKVIFQTGSQITANDVQSAKKLGKLVQLTLYSTPIKN